MTPDRRIARHFAGRSPIIESHAIGNGLINDTYKIVTLDHCFILQRLNDHVFPEPEQLIANLQRFNRHLRRLPPSTVQLKIPTLIPTIDNQWCVRDNDQWWRALHLISPAESRRQLTRPQEAEQVGKALGHFHQLCSALSPADFYDTLPGFHITPAYYQHYCQQLDQPPAIREENDDSRYCRAFIDSFADKLAVLENARQRGELQERLIHGDPKLDNFLFLPDSDTVVSLIDLDTLKPGLLHYDIGDCIRSCCQQSSGDRFHLQHAERLLQHYLHATADLLTAADCAYLYSAIELIPFELGLRFFTDYLAGNTYFKVDHPQHNLRRAVAQFQLCQAITAQASRLQALISRLQQPQ